MEPSPGKRAAQERVDRIRAFRRELEQLRRENAIELTPEQRERLDIHLNTTLADLAGRYDVDTTESQKQISWGMRIVSTIAGLALCAAVVLFFYRIWGLLSIPAQVAVLVITPLLSIAAMEFSSRRERTFYYTALLGIIAFAAAVLNLNALGGIFNFPPSPNAFLVWAIFALGLAYAYRLRLLLAAGLVCGVLFAAMMLTQLSGEHWGALDSRFENVILPAALVIALPMAWKSRDFEEFPWVYQMVGLVGVLAGMFFLSINGRASYLPLSRHSIEILYEFAGLGAGALAMWLGVTRRMPSIVNTGAAFFALFLYVRLFRWWWDWMPRYLFFLVIGLISLGLLYVFQRLRRRTREAASI